MMLDSTAETTPIAACHTAAAAALPTWRGVTVECLAFTPATRPGMLAGFTVLRLAGALELRDLRVAWVDGELGITFPTRAVIRGGEIDRLASGDPRTVRPVMIEDHPARLDFDRACIAAIRAAGHRLPPTPPPGAVPRPRQRGAPVVAYPTTTKPASAALAPTA